MIEFRKYFYKTTTIENYSVVVGGLYDSSKTYNFKKLEIELTKLTINNLDIVEIDERLASILIKYTKGKLTFVGSCIVANVVGNLSSGGVIGNPNIHPKSAEGICEDVGYEYTLLSYPESPGILFKQNKQVEKYLLEILKTSSDKIKTSKEIAKYFIEKYKQNPFLLVCDGCNKYGGLVFVYDGKDYEYFES